MSLSLNRGWSFRLLTASDFSLSLLLPGGDAGATDGAGCCGNAGGETRHYLESLRVQPRLSTRPERVRLSRFERGPRQRDFPHGRIALSVGETRALHGLSDVRA